MYIFFRYIHISRSLLRERFFYCTLSLALGQDPVPFPGIGHQCLRGRQGEFFTREKLPANKGKVVIKHDKPI